MAHTRLIVVAIMALPFFAQGQNVQPFPPAVTDTLLEPRRAIYFFLINQTSLTYVGYLSENRAWNITADVSGSYSSESRNPTNIPQEMIKEKSFSLTLTPQMQWFINSSLDPVRLFVAVGPSLNYSVSDRTVDEVDNLVQPPYKSGESSTTRAWAFGALLTGGIEAKVIKLFSVVAKYELSGTYTKQTVNQDGYSGTGPGFGRSQDNRVWRISLSPIRLGIGIHF